MKLTNWLGQDIEVGSYVYRGAREGNSSSFKVGKVTKVNPQKQKVTVAWGAEAPYRENTYVFISGQRVDIDVPGVWNGAPRPGTSHKDTLVVISEKDYMYAVCRNTAAHNAEQAFKSGLVTQDNVRAYFNDETERLVKEFSGV
jgi:hypothetical protein